MVGAGVVRPQKRRIALGLIGDHLDDFGQVLAFRGEFDHSPLVEVADFDEKIAALLQQPRHTRAAAAGPPSAILMVGR